MSSANVDSLTVTGPAPSVTNALLMAPPARPALLPVKVDPVTVSVPVASLPSALSMAPPKSLATLSVNFELATTRVPPEPPSPLLIAAPKPVRPWAKVMPVMCTNTSP